MADIFTVDFEQKLLICVTVMDICKFVHLRPFSKLKLLYIIYNINIIKLIIIQNILFWLNIAS